MKTAILYVSVHHKNTEKVVKSMAEVLSADLIDLAEQTAVDISEYDMVGFASGCFYHSMHEKIKKYIGETAFPQKQKVFLVCTCGINYRDYTKGIKKLLNEKGVSVIGSFQCRGYDTFGPFEKIGGIAKEHPDEKDLDKAQKFAKELTHKM